VSILSVGTFFGALAAAPTGDLVGRRMGIMLTCIIFCAGVAMQTASTALPLFIAGRTFAGFGVGMVSCLVPMYQSECSPKWIRGAGELWKHLTWPHIFTSHHYLTLCFLVVSLYQWAITIGLFLAAIVNNSTQARGNHSSYRIPIAIQFVWAAVLVGGMSLLPEVSRTRVRRLYLF
jgi:MFS transporter, SP family, sugar:H+ symporter